jgi:hypothetical protein
MSAQVLIGGTSSIFGPAICAISLEIVGRKLFDRRQGRNQTFNSAGNVVAAVSMGLLVISFPIAASFSLFRFAHSRPFSLYSSSAPMRLITSGRGAQRKATQLQNPPERTHC